MSFSIINGVLSAAVATSGTFTAAYPSGKNAGSFFLAMGHKITINGNAYFFPVDFDVTLGASITVTNKHASTWPADAEYRLQMEEMGDRAQISVPMQSPNVEAGTSGTSMSQSINVKSKLFPSVTQTYVDLVNLGAPAALDADGIAAAQSFAATGVFAINGALASGGAVTLDVPRAIQAVSTAASTVVVTVTGTDVYGRAMTEALTLNGTTAVVGKKAFKTISGATAGGAIDGPATIGTTDILGLPVFVPADGFVLAELRDGHKVGGGGSTTVPFTLNQTDLLAGTAQQLISPVAGFITGARAIVSSTIATGGNIAVYVATTKVTGLTLVFADGALPGAVASDTPTTPFSSTTVVAAGSRIQVEPDASFATSGAAAGFVEITGLAGTLVAGIRLAGGSTTTSGDVRGTYTPSFATDGSSVIQLIVAYADRFAGMPQNVSGA